MTDYYIAKAPSGSDSNDGLSLSTPKATVNSMQAAYNFTPADKIFFRAGTYTTELSYGPVGEVNIYMELDNVAEHVSLEGYADETVVFEMPVNEKTFVGFTNVNGPTDDTVYTIKKIHFKNGVGEASESFIMHTQSSSSTTFTKVLVDNCIFTQLATEADLTQGAVYSAGVVRGKIEVTNCEFNITDETAIFLKNQMLVTVTHNTFNIVSPTTNDNTDGMVKFLAISNPADSRRTELYFTNNEINYTFSDGMSGDTILIKPEYFNGMHINENTFNLTATNIQSNRIIDTIRPATSTSNGRTTDIINIVGNTFNNSTGRGDVIEFYRPSTQTTHTAVVNLNYNTFLGNDEMRNNTSNQVFDSFLMYATEFNCIGNTFSGYQDFIVLKNMQNTPFVIEDNIFKNGGNNNFGSSGDTIPLSIYVVESDGGVIKNNTFFIEEEGTCIRLHNAVTNDIEVTGNSFVYLGDTRTASEEYIILNINPADLDEVTIDNNYYYGLEKLGDTTLFEYAPTATFDEAMALTDTDVTFHTTNIIKRDVAKSMTSRLTKDIAWKI